MRKVLLLAACAVVAGCGGASRTSHHTQRTVVKTDQPPSDPVLARLGLPPLHSSSPLPGYLMIADRDNNRIIVVNPAKRIVWRFPRQGD